jgi:hypothetical protein
MSGWAGFLSHKGECIWILLLCVACCVSQFWLSSAAGLGAWGGGGGEGRVRSLMPAAVEREVFKSYLFSFIFDVSSIGHSACLLGNLTNRLNGSRLRYNFSRLRSFSARSLL